MKKELKFISGTSDALHRLKSMASCFNTIVDLLNGELGTAIKPTYVPNPIKNYVQQADTTKAQRLLKWTEYLYGFSLLGKEG